MTLYTWSKTASSNATADATINWAEGQSPSSVNDSARATMAAVAKYRDDVNGSLTTGGTSTAYTLSSNQVFDTLGHMDKQTITFVPHATNGAAPTLNVDGLGGKAVNKSTGSAVATGDLLAGTPYNVTYFNATNEFILEGSRGVTTGTVASVATGWGLTGGTITASGTLSLATSNPAGSFEAPINLQLNASVATNILTIAVKGNNGSDPSATNPVLIPFRDSTLTAGDPVWVAITAALSITTNAVGATLGSSNNVPFRICAFNNGGTVVLALINCSTQSSTAVQIFPLDETGVASTTGISAAATSAGVFYTPNGTTLTNKAFRVIGHLDYDVGGTLATAGTYTTAPTKLQLHGPGVRLPGAVVQTIVTTTTTTAVTSTSTGVANKVATSLTGTLTPTSGVNPIKVTAAGAFRAVNTTTSVAVSQLFRGTGATVFGNISPVSGAGSGAQLNFPTFNQYYDSPQANTSTQYGLYIWIVTIGGAWTFLGTTETGTNTGVLTVEEIMG
jgi:hypothetical protein